MAGGGLTVVQDAGDIAGTLCALSERGQKIGKGFGGSLKGNLGYSRSVLRYLRVAFGEGTRRTVKM